ncbi:hypothetical protein [Cohnella sp. REN36]|uniref:hypothetical protein n=1 Tax=Cohnella sp. REN36 TaxID=2887347 RepID=UPI001D15BFD5|nr:hypothetical protein [Cohnella sp. REN36]MCC3373739.1 hypothetical protein [Cohnella sp. REN36]
MAGRKIGFRSDEDFPDKQRVAWENTKRAIHARYPCYGYNLGIPEYYVVNGYDEGGYYFVGIGTDDWQWKVSPASAKLLGSGIVNAEVRQLAGSLGVEFSENVIIHTNGGVYELLDDRGNSLTVAGEAYLPWDRLATVHIGLLEMFWIEPGVTSSDRETVKDALSFALEFAQSPQKWVYDGYKAGLDAYDNFIRGFAQDRHQGFGLSINAEAWTECREMAGPFLREARDRIGGSVSERLLKAAAIYDAIHEQMRGVRDLFPFYGRNPEDMRDKDRISRAVAHLERAKELERKGLHELEQIVCDL